MSRLDTLSVWVDRYDDDAGCTVSWLEYEYFNDYLNRHQRFSHQSNQICNAHPSCENCTYQTPHHILEQIKEIPGGIVNANPSGPF